MVRPIFNYKTYSEDIGELKGGTAMDIGTLSSIVPPKEGERTRIQMFSSGKRMTNDTVGDYSDWNNCVYEDVDYKVWIAKCNREGVSYIEPGIIFKNVWNWLITNYPDNTYYMEFSRSNNGFHIIYYLDEGEKSEKRVLFTKSVMHGLTIEAFKQCGYGDIIEYYDNVPGVKPSKVHDSCTNNIVQLCFFTGKGIINNECTGRRVPYNFKWDDLEIIRNERRIANNKRIYSEVKSDVKFIYDYLGKKDIDSVGYIDHYGRWELFNSLSRLFDNDKTNGKSELEKEWEYCCSLIPNNSVDSSYHTLDFYLKEPYKNDWEINLNGTERCNKKLLSNFGYMIKVKTQTKTVNDRLTDIIKLFNMEYE